MKKLSVLKNIKVDKNIKLYLIYLQHFVNDIHISFLQTFIPFLIENIGISVTQAGVLTSLPGLFNMFLQPVIGFLSDRSLRPFMIVFGPLLTALGASLIPSSTSFGSALVLVSIWGLGNAVFHPQGHGAVGYVGEIEKIPVQLAVFSMAGILGSSLSPLYAAFLFKYFRELPLSLFPVIPVIFTGTIFWIFAPYIRKSIKGSQRQSDNFLITMEKILHKIWPVWIVTFLKDICNHGIKFLLPLLVALRGGGIEKVGLSLFLIQIAKVLSPLLAGRFALVHGKKKVLIVTQGLAPFLLFPELFFTGWIPFASFMLGNALLVSSSPILVAKAQQEAPGAKSTATSLLMGVAYGLSGLLMTLVGLVVDTQGIITAFSIVLLFPLINVFIIIFKWPRGERSF